METIQKKPTVNESKYKKAIINVLTPYFEYKNKKGITIKYGV
jgi:hypothetical protein